MLENIFTFLYSALLSILTTLKVIIRSNLFIAKKGKQSGKSCLILGNGPSLKNVLANHVDDLKNQTLWCVNNFPNTEYFKQVKPSYFLFVASGYYKPETIKHEQETRDKIIKKLVEDTDWNLVIYCPNEARKNKKFINYLAENPNLEVRFFNKTPIEGLAVLNRFFFRKRLGMPRPHNVLIPTIMVAIQEGFDKICLLGADHSWLPLLSVNDKNEALINQKHFYQDKKESNGQMYQNAKPRRLHQILEKFMYSFKAYFELRDFADSKGVKIYNCTPNSFIDAFERKKISIILGKMCKKKIT